MGKMPLLGVQSSAPKGIYTAIVGVFQDSKGKTIYPDPPFGDWVKRLEEREVFDARRGQVHFIRFAHVAGAENLLFVGLGRVEELSSEKLCTEELRKAGGNCWTKLVSEKVKDGTVVFMDDEMTIKQTRAFAEGLVLGAYRFDKYKSRSSKENESPSELIFLTTDSSVKEHLSEELKKVDQLVEAIAVTRDWSNEPSNIGTPEYFTAEARKLARRHGLKFKFLDKKAITREKMGLFLGVNQGSDREPRLVIVEYTPPKSRKSQSKKAKRIKTLAFVGKGVTFDTGGISIKPAARMEDMKHDMTGAATVMGAVLLAAQWEVPNRVIGVMAFTENMPSGKAIQPGNILTARNGKTVEVINTDAEGRLILGDALDYIQDVKPDAVVDVATLTGAITVALGKYTCGLFGNDNALVKAVQAAGDACGERTWEMPLFDEYFNDLKSDCADMRNVGHDPSGGAIRAAAFLKQFIRKGTSWAHLDIAASACHLTHLSYFPKKGAAGSYVRTLAQLAMDY